MEVKKAIKKVVALSAGAIMVGATIMGAMAADLAEYPKPFITEDVRFDGTLVVGASAKTEDVIGAIDISNGLQAEAIKSTPISGASTEVAIEGDAWLVRSGDKKLELGNSWSSASEEEVIKNITSYIGSSELAALGDGEFADKKYHQYLYFDKYDSGFVQFMEYSDTDVQADHFIVPNNKQIARYVLEFVSSAESDIDTSAGAASTSGTYLTDYQDKKLNLFGKEFTVVTARRSGGNTAASAKLTMMSGSTKSTLNQGEADELSVGEKSYDVELTYVDDSDRASFVVNGEATGKINVGDSYKLGDGNKIGVSSVYYQALETGTKQATFFLGAKDVVVWDTNIQDSVSSKNLYTDGTSTSVTEAAVTIKGTDDNTTFKIDSIEVNMTAGDDYWVAPGEKLSEVIAARGDKEQVLFTQNWDIEYKGLTTEETGEINIKNSGDSAYILTFNDANGNAASLPVGIVNSDNYYFGDSYSSTASSARYTILNESAGIKDGDYFILTDESVSDGNRKSFVFQYKGADKYTSDSTTPTISFKDVGSGDTVEVTHKRGENVYIKYGGGSFQVRNVSGSSGDDTNNDFDVEVDFDASGSIGDDTATTLIAINTKEGSKIAFTPTNGTDVSRGLFLSSGMNITISTPDGDDYDNLVPKDIIYKLSASGSSDQVTLAEAGGLTVTNPTGETENYYGMNSMGALVHRQSPTSGRPKVFIKYPAKQALPQVFITSGAIESTTTTSGGSVSQEVVPINVGAAKLDSEVMDKVGSDNLIVIGGPCANSVAAKLMGNPDPCYKDFKEGESLIKLFEEGDAVSMLVAGMSAADTRKASEIVKNHKDVAGFEGMEITIKTVDGTVTKVEAVAAADEVVEA